MFTLPRGQSTSPGTENLSTTLLTGLFPYFFLSFCPGHYIELYLNHESFGYRCFQKPMQVRFCMQKLIFVINYMHFLLNIRFSYIQYPAVYRVSGIQPDISQDIRSYNWPNTKFGYSANTIHP